ncbi:unnamed protein product, partial [Rotaria sp. Silwood1]
SAKITMSFPRSVGQVPIYYNHYNTGRPGPKSEVFWSHYGDESNKPLYPFGYGLSYSKFEYSNLRIDDSNPQKIKVSIDVKNTSSVSGEEITQLYIHQKTASVVRPVKELKGFNKVKINAGETKELEFNLTDKELGFYNNNGDFVVEAGTFDVMVIVDVNGVGYDLHISLNTYDAINQQENGLLYTYLHITENAQTLFGFADVKEKEIFLHLISISGVGATTARIMLSNMKPSEIAKFIVSGSVNDLIRIKGIGKKTAELLVIGLRDKLSSFLTEQIATSNNYTLNPMEQDAVDALIALGINKPLAEKAVNKVLKTNTNIAVQDIIKLALKNL